MKDYMEGFINRVNGLHNSIANDAWPKCCGEEMGDIAQKEGK